MKDNLKIQHFEGEFDLSVDALFWQDIKAERILLYPQAAKSPYGTSEKELWVKAAYNKEEIAFLIEFEDSTQDLGTPANPDACALLLAAADAPATAQMMGYESTANVWQWLAERDVERFVKGNTSIKAVRELIAHGPGTQTPLEKQNVEGKGIYSEGKWKVIFKRKLKSNQEDEFQLKVGTNMRIAFALWDGSKMESFSRKSIAILRKLSWEI
ncbi:MAG: ethylbenzene dehydrogenase-related protein [Fidelibacterota bacterium]